MSVTPNRLRSRLRSFRSVVNGEPYLCAAALLCVAFGLAFIANVQPIGDGMWFWYAHALRQGQSLYHDLHAPMQPLFFLLTAATQMVFGNSWLASKILAVLQLFAYCLGLALVCRRVLPSDKSRATLMVAVYGLTIMVFYARFDDFHITGHCLVVYSIYLLLRLRDMLQRAHILRCATLLGLFSGMAMANRLNDGALLFVCVGACVLVFAREAWLRALLVFAATGITTLALLVFATRSNLHDWLQYTVLRAAAIKGGSQHMLLAPINFPLTVLSNLLVEPRLLLDLSLSCIVIGLFAYGTYFRAFRTNRFRLTVTLFVIAASVPPLLFLLQQSLASKSVLALSDALGLVFYALLIFLPLRVLNFALLGRLAEWNRNEALILIPFGQLYAGAMTSGGSILEAYAPLAFFLLLVPLILPAWLRTPWRRTAFAVLLSLLAVGSLVSKTFEPYHWLHYSDRALFVERAVYNHPSFGPMVIETDQLALMRSMCAAIKPSTTPPQLLAMPWPYPNYFCNIPPWHNYVQTWYDTSSKQTIDTLTNQLRTDPPEWIVYQRSLETLLAHENTFMYGKKLPHRAMDEFIVEQLRSGHWSLPWQRCFGGTDWLVIHTRAAAQGEPNEDLLPSQEGVNLCASTNM